MSYRCEQCEQTTTVGDVLNSLFKIGVFAGVAYMAFNFRNEIKGAVQSVIKKAGSQVSGTTAPLKKRKGPKKHQGHLGKRSRLGRLQVLDGLSAN